MLSNPVNLAEKYRQIYYFAAMRFLLTLLCISGWCGLCAQDTIGIIEVYGNRTLSADAILKASQLKVGAPIDRNTLSKATLINRIKALPGVKDVAIEIVCCDDKTGKEIVYLGIAESTDYLPVYRKDPDKGDRLPADIIGANELYFELLSEAIRQGRNQEDHVAGYALMKDSATRLQQLKFVDYARQYEQQLKEVLHNSGNAEHRAIATMVIAYDDDKEKVIPELLYATQDSDETVRNNATRALWILADYLPEHPEIKATIPAAPFIRMINSLSWTDRNKGSLVLSSLTQQRDKTLLSTLKKECLPALTEMARWNSKGHAFSPYIILGRIAGASDQRIFETSNDMNRKEAVQMILDLIEARY
jgi:hypothetical protein